MEKMTIKERNEIRRISGNEDGEGKNENRNRGR